MEQIKGERNRESRMEYRAGTCGDREEESPRLLKFMQYQLTSSLVLQKAGGHSPPLWVPNLEIASKILLVCVCFHRGLQLCKSLTPK